MRATIDGLTTLYPNAFIEYRVNSNTLVKYYHADGQRIAMREGSSTLYYFVSDHLGSTALTLNQNGTVHSETRYKPFGETAWSSTTPPTRRRYTGQLQDFDLPNMQLYFYNARYYDPALARFTQADTIVPSLRNPQTLNRFSYVNNNPVKYTDSTGHCPDQACYEAEWYAKDQWFRARGFRYNSTKNDWRFDPKDPWSEVDNANVGLELLAEAGITLNNVAEWTEQQIIAVAMGVGDLSRAIGSVEQLNKLIGGYATIYLPTTPAPLNCLNGPACALPPPWSDGHSVYFRDYQRITKYDTVHELAHIIDWNSSIVYNYEYYYNGALREVKATGTFSTVWGIATTEYSTCLLCVQTWESWADGVALYVYGAEYYWGYGALMTVRRPGARPLSIDEIDIMNGLLSGNGW